MASARMDGLDELEGLEGLEGLDKTEGTEGICASDDGMLLKKLAWRVALHEKKDLQGAKAP